MADRNHYRSKVFMNPWQTQNDNGDKGVWYVRGIEQKRVTQPKKKSITGVMFERGLYSSVQENAFATILEGDANIWVIRDRLIESSGDRVELPFNDRRAFARYLGYDAIRTPAVKAYATSDRFADLGNKKELAERQSELTQPGSRESEAFAGSFYDPWAFGEWTPLHTNDKGVSFVLCADQSDWQNDADPDEVAEILGATEAEGIFPIGPFHALQIKHKMRWADANLKSEPPYWIRRESVDAQRVQDINTEMMKGRANKFRQWVAYDEPTAIWIKDFLEQS